MKTIAALVLGAFIVAFEMTPAPAGEMNELIIVTEDHEDFPYVIGNTSEIDPVRPGAAVEAVNIIGDKLGFNIQYKRVPWKRALEMELKSGRAQGLLTASYKKERELFGAYPKKNGEPDKSRSLFSNTYVLYRLKGSDVNYDGKKITGLTKNIGGPRGYSIVDDLKRQGYGVEVSESTLTDMKKMLLGRTDLVVALEMTGDKILRMDKKLNNEIEKIDPPLSTKEYYLILSNQFVQEAPETAEKIWDMVGDIRENKFRELAEKYLE